MSTCMFCSSSKQMTREHVWGDWTLTYFKPSDEATRMRDTHHVTIEGDDGRLEVAKGKLRNVGAPHSKRVRIVCSQCNNGWMSLIEENMKLAFGRNFWSESDIITAEDANAIRLWLYLKLLIQDRIYDKQPLAGVTILPTRESLYRDFYSARLAGEDGIPLDFQFVVAKSKNQSKWLIGQHNFFCTVVSRVYLGRRGPLMRKLSCIFLLGPFLALVSNCPGYIGELMKRCNDSNATVLVELCASQDLDFSLLTIDPMAFEENALVLAELMTGQKLRRNIR